MRRPYDPGHRRFVWEGGCPRLSQCTSTIPGSDAERARDGRLVRIVRITPGHEGVLRHEEEGLKPLLQPGLVCQDPEKILHLRGSGPPTASGPRLCFGLPRVVFIRAFRVIIKDLGQLLEGAVVGQHHGAVLGRRIQGLDGAQLLEVESLGFGGWSTKDLHVCVMGGVSRRRD